MNTQMLKSLLYEHRGEPDLLLEAYKMGCRHERLSAKRREKDMLQQAKREIELEKTS